MTHACPPLWSLALALGVWSALGCRPGDTERATREAPSGARARPLSSEAALPAPGNATASRVQPVELTRLVRELSEPDRGFISDNYLSNEMSYLDVVPLLRERPAGGVYVGVGPEQNFTYIAATRPELAFIVDIRRDNLLLHLLYKAMFEIAEDRTRFLCLWLSRNCDGWISGESASLDRILDRVSAQPVMAAAAFEGALGRLMDQVVSVDGFLLGDPDREAMRRALRAFHDQQFEMAFRLKKHSTRRYPTLRELVAARDASGAPGSFLSSERDYRLVRNLHRDNKIVPVVGDFAGRHALAGVAREMRHRGLQLNAFYVSNVEQYLLGEPARWRRWMDNLVALPRRSDSLVLRAYLDQGQKHPRQRPGRRSATVAQSLAFVLEEQNGSSKATLLELTSEHIVAPP